MQPGDKFYFVAHAYHHLIGVVREVLGPKRVIIDNVIWVYSSAKSWTDFFSTGVGERETTYHLMPDGTEVDGWILKYPWHHNIPKDRKYSR